jgi:prevent-host-death family protein
MREIGVRDLKANLSHVLRRIEEGEQMKVTLRGRHVADLVPAGSRRSDEQQLVADGRVTPASRPRPKARPRPLATGRSATAAVLDERDDER